MRNISVFLGLLLTLLLTSNISAQQPIPLSSQLNKNIDGTAFCTLNNKQNNVDPTEVFRTSDVSPLGAGIPNLGVTTSTHWLRVDLFNNTLDTDFAIQILNPLIDDIAFYKRVGNQIVVDSVSNSLPFGSRNIKTIYPSFRLEIPSGENRKILLKLKTSTQLLVPVRIVKFENYRDEGQRRNILTALYLGVMSALFLYNMFLFFSTRTRSYFYYILYIASVAGVQANVSGFGFRFIWPNFSWLEQYAAVIFSGLTAYTSIAFAKEFLRTKVFAPKLQKGFVFFVFGYSIAIVASLAGFKHVGYNLLNILGLLISFYVIGLAAYIWARKKFKPALFFLISWSVFFLGVIMFVMKDIGVLPYNLFTVTVLQLGSGIEAILLGLALADRINILKKEKEASQARALAAAQENERIIREQNALLERKVEERTHALRETNGKLETALTDLKETQSQMVEQEKMASLGQLTAGIAHEINNPINFVTSNIKPLRRDFNDIVELFQRVEQIGVTDNPMPERRAAIERAKEDVEFDYLKEEVDILLQGIYEGSTRTAEIVKGLRVFSRLDESDLKRASVEEGLDSTCLIVNNLLNNKIEIIKDYASIPPIECYAGKINQVFLNLMTNAIHAIRARFGDNHGGKLILKTELAGNGQIAVSISDNGTGMAPEVKQKIFEPFFTTKDVGEGTGLGLSITWKTVVKHNGHVNVDSVVGEGTTFTLVLPINQPSKEEIEHSSNVAVTSHE